jgi:hypothetical protein
MGGLKCRSRKEKMKWRGLKEQRHLQSEKEERCLKEVALAQRAATLDHS